MALHAWGTPQRFSAHAQQDLQVKTVKLSWTIVRQQSAFITQRVKTTISDMCASVRTGTKADSAKWRKPTIVPCCVETTEPVKSSTIRRDASVHPCLLENSVKRIVQVRISINENRRYPPIANRCSSHVSYFRCEWPSSAPCPYSTDSVTTVSLCYWTTSTRTCGIQSSSSTTNTLVIALTTALASVALAVLTMFFLCRWKKKKRTTRLPRCELSASASSPSASRPNQHNSVPMELHPVHEEVIGRELPQSEKMVMEDNVAYGVASTKVLDKAEYSQRTF